MGVPDRITFASGLNGGTIFLTLGQMAIVDSLVIDASGLAAGLSVDASGNDLTPVEDNGDGSRIFLINNNNDSIHLDVELHGVTLTGGDSSGWGGAILSHENLMVTDSNFRGNFAKSVGERLLPMERSKSLEVP